MGLRRICSDVRFLGSYPRADGRRRPCAAGRPTRDVPMRRWLTGGRAGHAAGRRSTSLGEQRRSDSLGRVIDIKLVRDDPDRVRDVSAGAR